MRRGCVPIVDLPAQRLEHVVTERDAMRKMYGELAASLRDELAGKKRDDGKDEQARYDALQASVPAGAGMIALLDDAWRLDFARNRVQVLDMPGFVSPRPGIPMKGSADEVARYFLERDLRYYAYVEPEKSKEFYRKADWERNLHREPEALPAMAPSFLAAFAWSASLRESRKAIWSGDGMVVLDLATAK